MYPEIPHSGSAAFAVVTCALFGFALCQYPGRCVTPLGQNGSCTDIFLCGTYERGFEVLDRHWPADVRQLRQLREQFKCDPDDFYSKICCPFEEGNDPDSMYREPPPPIDGHRNLRLLPRNCGRLYPTTKIIGGKNTGLLEFPCLALISTDEGGAQKFTCGGTIISERYILTAAHCITNLGAKVLAGVRVGEYDYSTELDCTEENYCNPLVQDFLIEKVIPHPGYVGAKPREKPQLDNDIGLLRLRGVIDFSRKNAQPICLPVTRELQEMRLDWETPVLPGWGRKRTNKDEDGNLLKRGNRPSTDLLHVEFVDVVTNKFCGDVYNRSIMGGVGFRQICARGEWGHSSCAGNAGGPLLMCTPKDLARLQVGVLSGGAVRCGIKNAPAIFNRVAYYMDWILDQLEP